MKRFKTRVTIPRGALWNGWPYLVVLLISFLLGVVGGFFFAGQIEPGSGLSDYLTDYFASAGEGDFRAPFLSVFWECVRWPLAVTVFGLTALGVAAIPVLLFVRGFLLSYAVTCFGLLLGTNGVAAAAALFAVSAVIILPILFVTGCEGLRSAYLRLPGTNHSTEGRYRLEILLPATGALTLAVALQWTVVPLILTAVCARLF